MTKLYQLGIMGLGFALYPFVTYPLDLHWVSQWAPPSLRTAVILERLLTNVYRVFATVLAIVLVFALSLRLRQREIQTIFKIGCSRMTIAKLIAAEIMIIVFTSAVWCGIMMVAVRSVSSDLVRMLFIK